MKRKPRDPINDKLVNERYATTLSSSVCASIIVARDQLFKKKRLSVPSIYKKIQIVASIAFVGDPVISRDQHMSCAACVCVFSLNELSVQIISSCSKNTEMQMPNMEYVKNDVDKSIVV